MREGRGRLRSDLDGRDAAVLRGVDIGDTQQIKLKVEGVRMDLQHENGKRNREHFECATLLFSPYGQVYQKLERVLERERRFMVPLISVSVIYCAFHVGEDRSLPTEVGTSSVGAPTGNVCSAKA